MKVKDEKGRSFDVYLNNPRLKSIDNVVDFTQEETLEYAKCMTDPLYFAKTYVRIVNVDEGVIPFRLWKFQEDMIDTYAKNRFCVTLCPRQVGKSTTVVAYLLWLVLFQANKNCCILAHKGATSRELLARLRDAYELLPLWMQQGVKVWNKGNIELENGSKVMAAATSSASIRGQSFNVVFLDEFAFVPNNMAEDFFSSVYPTIASGKTTQVIIVSTPNGMNHFYKIWTDAMEKRNRYAPIRVHWQDVPGRDEEWKQQTIANTSMRQFRQEMECVAGETLVTVRNKETGQENRIPVSKIFDCMQKYDEDDEYRENLSNSLEVLTPSGYVSFDGIRKLPNRDVIKISLSGGIELKATVNHKVKTTNGFMFACNLMVGDNIITDDGVREIVDVTSVIGNEDVFDLINVANGNEYFTNGIVSHNCAFLGSAGTLIDGLILERLVYHPPIYEKENLNVYELPQSGHTYVLTADCGKGMGMDYSAFSVVDVTEIPYRLVATYRDNTISHLIYPNVIKNVATMYNKAWVMVELNDVGQAVADILWEEHEYEEIFMTEMNGRKGQQLSSGVGGKQVRMGLQQSVATKNLGCANLKSLIEDNKLLVHDFETISELSTFIQKGKSFEAEEGRTDDSVMSLVIFAWLTTQPLFKELTSMNIRDKLFQAQAKAIEEELLPIFYSDGRTDGNEVFRDASGQVWERTVFDK